MKLNCIKPYLYEIPQNHGHHMLVPARVFASPAILDEIRNDRSLEQLANMATLPGAAGQAIAMPDIHQGYGFPIGGVLATRFEDGVVSPGGVGYDINCGVRTLLTPLKKNEFLPHLERILRDIFKRVPSGFEKSRSHALSSQEMDEVLMLGARRLVEWGQATEADLQALESGGTLASADARFVSPHAKERGKSQLGSLGSGNHFLEIQFVEQVFDRDLAQTWGLSEEQVVIMIHTGSRGVGHQTCTDFVKRMVSSQARFGFSLPDRELACAPLNSTEGKEYLGAMAACANFAWANRQLITHKVREAFGRELGISPGDISILYDVAHNIAKIETHEIEGKPVKLCVHRKGATRAFPGQPVIIPGTMGTFSYILAGTEKAMRESFGTVCHGAGRRMSRTAAKKIQSGQATRSELKEKGILVLCESNAGLAEEAPYAYKDVNEVVSVVEEAGLAQKVARLVPLGVIKGG